MPRPACSAFCWAEPRADEPFAQIRGSDHTGRNGPPIAIQIDRRAVHRPPRNKGVERIRRRSTAAIRQAVLTATELSALRSIHAPQANASAVDFDRITIMVDELPDRLLGQFWDATTKFAVAQTHSDQRAARLAIEYVVQQVLNRNKASDTTVRERLSRSSKATR